MKTRGTMGAAVMAALSAGLLGAQDVVDLQAEDRALSPTLEEVFRVGSMDGDVWETFGAVEGVGFDARGNLYVFDRQASRVTVVDPSGRFVREVGQPGEGPGELRMPAAFTVLHDGSVVIADMGHRAYSIFGPDGAYERSVSMGEGSVIRIGDIVPDPRGGAVFSGGGRRVMMSFSGPGGGGGGGDGPDEPTTRPVERISLDGDVVAVTTVADGWLPPRAAPTELRGGGMRLSMQMAGPRVFEPDLLIGVLPDGGVAYADTTTYTVRIVDAEGTLQRTLRRPFTPRPLTPAMEEAERERQLAELEEGGGPQVRVMTTSGGGGGGQVLGGDAVKEMMRNRIDQLEFYPELPVLMDLRSGWNGKLWVRRRGAEPTEPGAMDVLTPAGQYVGTFAPGQLAMPAAFGPDGLVAFVETDEFDVPTVVVRRLPAILR